MSKDMDKPKHTPGPWKEHDGFVVGPDFETIADPRCLPPTSENMDTMDANARLIAASPTMYAALEKIVHWLDGLNGDGAAAATTDAVRDKARAALAAARGE